MFIYKVTHRHYYGHYQPHECRDHTVGYYSNIEKARAAVKDFLGEEATCDNDFGFDIWTSPHLPHTEYFVEIIKVW